MLVVDDLEAVVGLGFNRCLLELSGFVVELLSCLSSISSLIFETGSSFVSATTGFLQLHIPTKKRHSEQA